MRMIGLIAAIAAVATVAMAEASAAQNPEHATVRQLMLGIIIPTSDVLFGVAEPDTDADMYWENVEAQAMALAEGARLLHNAEGIDHSNGAWNKYTNTLVDAALETAAASKTRDVDAVFDAGFKVYDMCDACHRDYMPERQDEEIQ